MTLSPAPATRAPRLTLAQPLRFAPGERTSEPEKDNARGGRNRSVTSGLGSLSLGPGGAGTPDAGQAGSERQTGIQDNRPAWEAGAPRSRSCSSPRSGGAAEAPLPPRRSRSSALGRAALTRCQRPSPATAAQATAATALYTPGARDRKSRGRTGRARRCREASRESRKPRPRPQSPIAVRQLSRKAGAGRAAFRQTLAATLSGGRAEAGRRAGGRLGCCWRWEPVSACSSGVVVCLVVRWSRRGHLGSACPA